MQEDVSQFMSNDFSKLQFDMNVKRMSEAQQKIIDTFKAMGLSVAITATISDGKSVQTTTGLESKDTSSIPAIYSDHLRYASEIFHTTLVKPYTDDAE